MKEPRKIKKKKLKELVNQPQIKGFVDECKKAGLLLNENEVEEGGTILKETNTNIKSRQRIWSTGKQSARKWKNLSNPIQIINEETPEEELCVAMATTGINTEPISKQHGHDTGKSRIWRLDWMQAWKKTENRSSKTWRHCWQIIWKLQ